MSALHEAIEEWDDDQIKWLLTHCADINERDEHGNTPLILAAGKGIYPEQIRDLIKFGADVHARDASGRTPLMVALDNGSDYGIRTLIEHFDSTNELPDIDADYEHGRLALLFAVYKNDVEAVNSLIGSGANPNTKNEQGRTPLMMAADLGHGEVASTLLKWGADVHARETGGNNWTALHIAAYAPQQETARILLEHEAEVDARDNRQWTSLIWAAWASSAATVRLLLQYGADIHAENEEGGSALGNAGWLGDKETIQALLDGGAASHPEHLREAFHAAFTDNNRGKAHLFIEAGLKIGLAEAVLLEDLTQIKSILAAGVEQNEADDALITAAAKSSSEIVCLLLENGADPNSACYLQQTPLMQAYWNMRCMIENIEVLLLAGADVNARDKHGNTPFTMRTGCYLNEEWRLRLMRKMFKRGADVNVQNHDGMTALMDAAWRGETSIARFLLKHGAQINLCDREGRTALIFAVTGGHTHMVQLLLEHGAEANLRATDGSTALTLAKRWAGKKIGPILLEAGAVE